MLRLTAIFIAVCGVLIAASLGAVCYLVFGWSAAESALIALATLTALILYNTVTSRLRDRSDLGEQIADLSRGTADLARQVAEIGRQVIALENQEAAARKARGPNDPLAAEISEMSVLVRQLAETVAVHDSRLRSARPIDLAGATPPVVSPVLPMVSMPEPEPRKPVLPAVAELREAAPEPVGTGPFKGKSIEDIVAMIRGAVDANRIDLYLQPVVTLPQRKVRYYEAMTRLRTEDGALILPSDFLPHAETAGLMPRIDNIQLFRCVQVLRRLLLKNREIGLFCNVSVLTLTDPDMFRQFSDFMEANRALAPSLMLEFTQNAFATMGPIENESLASLFAMGFRFSMDHVTDLRMGPRDLSDQGVRVVKASAALLLNKTGTTADIHAADLSDLLGRHAISLIADRIETEASVVDLLDYDVRFGQGFLFSPPRPVRAEALQSENQRTDVIVRDGAVRDGAGALADQPRAGLPRVAAARAAI